jgi:hypothetical protein
MNNPQIIKEEVDESGDKTLVITTFDDGEVIFVELDES